jgi:hypothetical protein
MNCPAVYPKEVENDEIGTVHYKDETIKAPLQSDG